MMDKNDIFVDYYKILECNRSATIDELRKSYQRLALTLHPDKLKENESNSLFHIIQKAWSVLRNPESKKQYDAELAYQENNELLLYDTIDIKDMQFNKSDKIFEYRCRCGGIYALESKDLLPPQVTVGCDECSFAIQVNIR